MRELTIKELDDVGEVHVVVQDDVPVVLHQGQGQEEHKVAGADVLGCPDRLPHAEHVWVQQLCNHTTSTRLTDPDHSSELLKMYN